MKSKKINWKGKPKSFKNNIWIKLQIFSVKLWIIKNISEGSSLRVHHCSRNYFFLCRVLFSYRLNKYKTIDFNQRSDCRIDMPMFPSPKSISQIENNNTWSLFLMWHLEIDICIVIESEFSLFWINFLDFFSSGSWWMKSAWPPPSCQKKTPLKLWRRGRGIWGFAWGDRTTTSSQSPACGVVGTELLLTAHVYRKSLLTIRV